MFALFLIFAAVAHAQLQPTVLQASEVSTYEVPIAAIAKNSHTMVLSAETKRMVCNEFCHFLTSGPCQQPNLGDDNCYMKLANNGSCPAGTIDCGTKPAKKAPSITAGIQELVADDGMVVPTGGPTYLDIPNGWLQKNNLIANNVSLPGFFKLGFKLTPRHFEHKLANIIHFSHDDNQCCSWGTRIPAIFFRPNTFDLQMIYGTVENENKFLMGFPRNDHALTKDVEYDLEFRIMEKGAQILVNDVCIAEHSMNRNTREAFDNVRVWAAGADNIHHTAAGAEISGLWISKLSGAEDYPVLP